MKVDLNVARDPSYFPRLGFCSGSEGGSCFEREALGRPGEVVWAGRLWFAAPPEEVALAEVRILRASPSLRSAPSGPSLSLVRCPPRFAQGTNQRLFLGLGSRIEDEVCSRERTTQTPSPDTRTRTCQCSTVCPLFQAQRRNGGQKMRRSTAKALLISKSIQSLHNGRRIFGGPSECEGDVAKYERYLRAPKPSRRTAGTSRRSTLGAKPCRTEEQCQETGRSCDGRGRDGARVGG